MLELLTPIHIIFYIAATVAIVAAVAVITVRNPVHSVLSLVVTFFAMASIWMLLRAEFLSLILILVYVGAVMTLFLFVVMMLNIDTESKRSRFVRYFPIGIVIMILTTGITINALGPSYFGLTEMPMPPAEPADFSNLQAVGTIIYTDYVYAFEIAGVLLLAAIIAAITLTHRGPVKRKTQKVSEQIAVRPQDRVHLINMASEPKVGE